MGFNVIHAITAETFRWQHRNGFTPIELSTGLVTIETLIGGLVIGESIIAAPELCGLRAQFDAIDSAVNRFKSI